MRTQYVLDVLLGLCVGDALGVPVEFCARAQLKKKPISEMVGEGSHRQPPGTWSDDSSLAFCLAESLCHGFNLQDMADKFCAWLADGYWTPHGTAFDVGTTTLNALTDLHQGIGPDKSGEKGEASNGNGSLMRILPLACYVADESDVFTPAHQVSAITHAHPRSVMACGMYIQMAVLLLHGKAPREAYQGMCEAAQSRYRKNDPYRRELSHFARVLETDIARLTEEQIRSGGYVVETLEAALWCLLTSSSYAETVLKAVNLGDDTDTTATVAGGLAGIHYGWESIPPAWVNTLARKADIFVLATRLQAAAGKK
jgi:ADP-ribosylglycohydrolase